MNEVVSADEFQSKVLDVPGPVLVDFFATWCGPCRMLSSTLDEVSAELGDKATIYKVDVDKNVGLAHLFGVMSVPAIMVFKDGKLVDEAMGAQPKENILAMLS